MDNFSHPMVTPAAAERCIKRTPQKQLADVRAEMGERQNIQRFMAEQKLRDRRRARLVLPIDGAD